MRLQAFGLGAMDGQNGIRLSALRSHTGKQFTYGLILGRCLDPSHRRILPKLLVRSPVASTLQIGTPDGAYSSPTRIPPRPETWGRFDSGDLEMTFDNKAAKQIRNTYTQTQRPGARAFFACLAGLSIPSLALAAPQTASSTEMVRDLEGQVLGSMERFDVAVGGAFSAASAPQTSANVLGPNIFEITLNNTGTGWSEEFLIGLPQGPAGAAQFAPMLVLFHGYGQTPQQLLTLTNYFAEAQARGWYVLAPMGAHQFNFSIEYAQRNVEQALGWCARFLSPDLDHLYAVGFSMGAGMATSYGARHQDPTQAQFAAIVNHTGTSSIRDVYWKAGDQSLLQSPLMFGASPNQDPFVYQRASTIDLDEVSAEVDPASDMLRNLSHIPVRTVAANFDPLTYLVDQATSFDAWFAHRGGSSDLELANASIHNWNTLDESDTLDWLETHSLDDLGPGITHRVLADRNGKWHDFEVFQTQAGAFTPLTWNVDVPGNRLLMAGVENLRRFTIDPVKLGLDPSQALRVLFHASDRQPVRIVVDGFSSSPIGVLRNGVPTSNWTWNANTQRVILRENQPGGAPTWTIEP